MKYRTHNLWIVVGFMLALAVGGGPMAAKASEPQLLVDEARITVERFAGDPDMGWFRKYAPRAKGMLIIPQLLKAGFFLGGSGGRGVLVLRNGQGGAWSQPAFYNVGSVSWGLQIGAKASEVIMLVLTPKGVTALQKSSFKFGGDVSVAAGPKGAGAEGATAPSLKVDYLSFSRSKGAFLGLSLEGAILKVHEDWNRAYYGRAVSPADILVKGKVRRPESRPLLDSVARVAR